MKKNEWLVQELIDAAYDSGYYAGRDEGGTKRHVATMNRRGKLRRQVLARLALVPDAELMEALAQGLEDTRPVIAREARALAARILEARQ